MLTKAGYAKQEYQKSTVEEKVRLVLTKYKLENNKELQGFLDEEISKNEIDDYIENEDNTITVKLNNYDFIINQENLNIINVKYNEKSLRGNRIIGEVYTISTGGDNASIKVVIYKGNYEKEIIYNQVLSTPQDFLDFNVSYIKSEYRWHIKSNTTNLAYSEDNTIDPLQYSTFNDISWNYSKNIHYYIIAVEER